MKNLKLIFSEIFLFFQSNNYKIAYKEWLLAGLENKLGPEWDQYIFPIYENTKRMLEACWLIHERLISKNSFKSIDRYYHLATFESTSPLALDGEMVENPFSILESFFSLDNLDGHKNYLKNWYKVALSKENCVSNPADYFFLYNQFTQLLNAGYIIASKKLIYHTTPELSLIASREDYPTLLCHVNTLSVEHAENPYQFIESFFVPEKIKQMRLGLLEWLYAAFSPKSSIKLLDKAFLFEQYENMLLVVEAFFLVLSKPLIEE